MTGHLVRLFQMLHLLPRVDKKVLKEIRFLVTIGVTTTKANTPIVFNPKRLLGPLLFLWHRSRIASLSFSQKVCG